MQWVRQQNRESDIAYANRVLGQAGQLGIARGLSSLGVRHPPSDPLLPQIRTWIVTGIPMDLEAPAVASLLEGDLRNVEMLRRTTAGRQSRWVFRASAPRTLETLHLQIEREGRLQPAIAWVTARLAPVPEVLRRYSDDRSRVPPRPLRPEPDIDMPDAISRPAAVVTPCKSPVSAIVVPTQHAAPVVTSDLAPKRLKCGAIPTSLSPQPNSGQGDCLPLSLQQYFQRHRASPPHVMAIRSRVAAHLLKYATDSFAYKDAWDGFVPSLEDQPATCSWEEYVRLIGTAKVPWGALEAQAAARTFGIPILVFVPDLGKTFHLNEQSNRPCCFLQFDHAHWQWLDGALSLLALDPPPLPQLPAAGLRGAGTPCGATSVAMADSLRSWHTLAASQVQQSGHRCRLRQKTMVASDSPLDSWHTVTSTKRRRLRTKTASSLCSITTAPLLVDVVDPLNPVVQSSLLPPATSPMFGPWLPGTEPLGQAYSARFGKRSAFLCPYGWSCDLCPFVVSPRVCNSGPSAIASRRCQHLKEKHGFGSLVALRRAAPPPFFGVCC